MSFLAKIFDVLSRQVPSNGLRIRLQRWRGVRIGSNVFLGYEVILDQTFPHLIEIEDHARIGPGAMILAHSRPGDCWLHHMGERQAAVRIGRHAAVYAGAIVTPGVTVGEGAIVMEGAVVTDNVPAYTVVAGNPGRVIEELPRQKAQLA